MKLKLLSITLFALIGLKAEAQIPTLEWAAGIGGTMSDVSRDIAVDASGNVYTIGNFKDSVDFDPSAGGVVKMGSNNGSDDVFITKFSSSGNFIWVKTFGGADIDFGMRIVVDASGNVYAAGLFENTTDLDPGAGTVAATSAGFYDMFILKLDNTGTLLWAKAMGSMYDEIPYALVLGPTGDVYTAGTFGAAMDFDPGAGVDSITPYGNSEVFIHRLDPNGNYVWTKRIGGTDDEEATNLVFDVAGNMYVSGHYSVDLDCDPGAGVFNLSTTVGSDVFIVKLNVLGNFVWAKSFGGSGNDYGYGLAVDLNSNVYTTGRFDGAVDFDPGAGTTTMTSAGSRDIYLCKLDSAGTFVWAKQMGGTSIDIGNSVITDAAGNIYTTGYFNGTADFDPSGATFSMTAGATEAFMTKFDAAGALIWAIQLGGTSSDIANETVLDATGNIYTCGYFNSTADFDPSTGSSTLTSHGFGDAFVVKLNQSAATGIADNLNANKVLVYPNPSNGRFTIEHGENVSVIRVMNVLGEVVLTSAPDANSTKAEINLENAPPGIYFYQIESESKKVLSGKIVVK